MKKNTDHHTDGLCNAKRTLACPSPTKECSQVLGCLLFDADTSSDALLDAFLLRARFGTRTSREGQADRGMIGRASEQKMGGYCCH